MFRTCEQCGLCSSACPITGKQGFNTRRLIRHIEMDLAEELTDTPWPWLCTTCGRCESVCPNGIAILDIIRPLRVTSSGPCSILPFPVRTCVPCRHRHSRVCTAHRPWGSPGSLRINFAKSPFPGRPRPCLHATVRERMPPWRSEPTDFNLRLEALCGRLGARVPAMVFSN